MANASELIAEIGEQVVTFVETEEAVNETQPGSGTETNTDTSTNNNMNSTNVIETN